MERLLCFAGELPNVKLIECEDIPLKNLVNFDHCLKIEFQNLKEFAGLKNLGESGHVMEGTLFSEEGDEILESHVAVHVHEEDGEMMVMISDPNDEELYHMKVNLDTGEGDNVNLPPLDDGGDEPMIAPDAPDVSDKMLLDRQLPPQGMTMRILFVLDSAFQSAFSSEGAMNDAVSSILAFSRTFFAHASLTSKITLVSLGTKKISQRFLATGNNLDSFRSLTNSMVASNTWPEADSYTLLSSENNAGGVVGIAWLRSTCSSSKGMRTNINEYFNGEIRTAQIVVHEIGHNLGMSHDFNGSPSNPRTADDGTPCSNQGGYMDYISNPTRWSQCSLEDFTKYHNAVRNANGQFCLPITGDNPNPNPTSTPNPNPNPTPQPTTPAPAPTCSKPTWINDGYCDDVTNTPECFYDGHDCCVQKRSNWDRYCQECECIRPGPVQQEWPECPRPDWVADTWCDDLTNTPECNYDGGDCCFQRRSNWDRFCNDCTCKVY